MLFAAANKIKNTEKWKAVIILTEKILSPQEERIERNHDKVIFTETGDSSRIERIFRSFANSRSSVDIQRAKYFTESFKQTEGETLVLRWAKALYHIAENIDVIPFKML